jgi:glycyl-tRNA synthetase beta chain
MSELFIEVRSEELPARFVGPAIEGLAKAITGLLKGVSFGAVTTWATPRRLAVAIADVAEGKPATEQLITGPAVAAAYKEGVPTPVAIGFAKGKGVAVEELVTVEGPKGKVIAAKVKSGGERTADLVAAGLEGAILGLAFPKSMRWGSGRTRWGRPLHSIIALFDGAVIPATVAGIATGDTTLGHRLTPGPLTVKGSADWLLQLRAHHVEPDLALRRARIVAQLQAAAAAEGATVQADEALIDQVTNLVEWPVTIPASFEASLLDLPPRLLVEAMSVHQRVFPLVTEGALRNTLLVVTNHPYAVSDPEAGATISTGNSRVLAARFYDARFFYAEDRKKRLDAHADKLVQRQWIRNGGTMADKAARLADRAAGLAAVFGAEADQAHRAGLLCKADLGTTMVGEFPELQGHVGRLLAGFDGEDAGVALAIEEHYQPRFSGDALPTTALGATLALADRLDNLDRYFFLGHRPQGNADPLGLRRNAVGLVTLLWSQGVRVSLGSLFGENKEPVPFVLTRLRALLCEEHATDLVEAVMASGDDDVVAIKARAVAMTALSKGADFGRLKTTFKRLMNITKEHDSVAFAPDALGEPAEQALAAAFAAVEAGALAKAEALDYTGALADLSTLQAPIDRLFTEVMVMAEDLAVRNNRLGLLKAIAASFGRIADWSRLSSEG